MDGCLGMEHCSVTGFWQGRCCIRGKVVEPWQFLHSLGTRRGSTEAHFALKHVKNSEIASALHYALASLLPCGVDGWAKPNVM